MKTTLPIRRKGAKFYLRKSFGGKQKEVALETTNQREAETRARQFLKTADLHGFEAAKNELRGLNVPETEKRLTHEGLSTLYKDYCLSIPASRRTSTGSQSAYLSAVKRFMRWSGADYVDEIDTTDAFIGWQKESPDQAESSYLARLRQASAVFKTTALKYYEKRGKTVSNPFLGAEKPRQEIKPYKPISTKLRGKIWKGEGLNDHQKMIVRLALGAGMRSGEISAARIDWLNKDHLEVIADERFTPKGKQSRTLPTGKEFVEMLTELRGDSDSEYLVPNKNTGATRLKGDLAFVTAWLRNLGIKDRKPIHLLRKDCGSLIAMTHPQTLFAAKDFLGHSSVTVTEKYYASLINPVSYDPIKMVKEYSD